MACLFQSKRLTFLTDLAINETNRARKELVSECGSVHSPALLSVNGSPSRPSRGTLSQNKNHNLLGTTCYWCILFLGCFHYFIFYTDTYTLLESKQKY